MTYNFEISSESQKDALKILINQCWKTLPIYEGKSKENEVIYSREEAYTNYQKHLSFLITKVGGASKIWRENQHYIELAYLLTGMLDITDDEHDKVKYTVHHCTKLLNKMIEEV